MQIVRIQKDKLHLNRLFLDDGQEILIDKDVCYEMSLKVGTAFDEQGLEDLIFESQYRRARARAIWHLDRMAHTEKGLHQKLIRAGFDQKASAKVIARMVEVGLLDDYRYAENLAEKLLNANVSKREAVQKMLQKGVPLDLARSVLETFDTDELSQIENLIEKKYRTKLLAENGTQKVYGALVRKGFSYDAIKTVLKKHSQELEEDYV